MTANNIRATVIWSCLDNSPIIAQSSAIKRGLLGLMVSTKTLPGCISAWKKLSRNTWVKKIVKPFSAKSARSMPILSKVAISEMGTPVMRSATITSLLSM